MAEPNALRGRPARYATQLDHPRNRLTVREWQVIGRALELAFSKHLDELVASGFFSDKVLADLKGADTMHLRRKIGLHMGAAMVEEYAAEFPTADFIERRQDQLLAKVAAGYDPADVISVSGRIMRRGNTFVIRDDNHACNGLTCTLEEFKIGSSKGLVEVQMYGIRVEVTLATLHEVRF